VLRKKLMSTPTNLISSAPISTKTVPDGPMLAIVPENLPDMFRCTVQNHVINAMNLLPRVISILIIYVRMIIINVQSGQVRLIHLRITLNFLSHFRHDRFRLYTAGMGECDENPKYMRNFCRRACVECYASTTQFGLEQSLPNNEDKRELTKKRIEESVEYMKRVWKDDEFSKVRHKCRNTQEDCTFWASIGECEANANYMKTNCAPACFSCDKLDIRHRCPIEPHNVPIWEPGDLNSLFENIVDNADGKGEYKQFKPIALSRPKMTRNGTQVGGVENDGPWVVLLQNFVTEEEADRLVELGKNQGYERSADVGKENPDGSHDSLVSESRTSHNTWCQDPSCYQDPLVKPVIDRIAEVTKTSVKNSEYLQLLQYEPGQYYVQHHDFIPHHRDMPCGVRIMTLFIYLNNVEEGGGTSFPLVNDGKGIVVQPKKGNAVLWPSVLDEAPESKDDRTDHEALPVIKGLKYGANAWIHSRDFKAAFAMNCH